MNKIDQAYDHAWNMTSDHVWMKVRDETADLQAYWNLRREIRDEVMSDPIVVQTTIHGTPESRTIPHIGLKSMRTRVKGLSMILTVIVDP